MSKKIILLIFVISVLFISGCVDKNTGLPQTADSELIPQINLPEGFSYIGLHETSVDISGSSEKALEGSYRYNGDDIYVQTIRSNDTASLIQKYKDIYKDANYNPFEEVSFNGHKATQIKFYVTDYRGQQPRYTLIWAAKEHMIIVGSLSDNKTVMTLAIATRY
ncbi:MAG: hypothetical protein J5U19_03050 [Candidatus Methanoperedens sp.]|nr:hypothetical protein [Candidatus Methanoperedens sp.]MCE8427358.1 hypothetical protein [Candidatus Methanoperedens sp.]